VSSISIEGPSPEAWPHAAAEAAPERLPMEFADEEQSVAITGFWMFLVTDLLIFASLFASYAVYKPMVASGPSAQQLFHLGPALLETLLLLTSSFTVGIAVWSMRRGQQRAMVAWMILTMLLGAGFVATELHEFLGDIAVGASWHTSAFLSAFFLLVSTHGAHVTFGILWALALLLQVARRGLNPVTARKIYTFSLYWHFLDIIWVFILTVVYLGGKVA
jgi:heme/copper-type cytochrome/quinol oxidase subunit 3